MLKYWKDPKDWTEWRRLFQEVQSELDEIKILDPIHIEPGEIVDTDRINEEYSKVDEAFQSLGRVKDKFNRLKKIAKRWYDQKRADMIIKAALNPGMFPSAEVQKAYGEKESKTERENFEACVVLSEAIHDERSRLYTYREDLEQMGHNLRVHRKNP